MVGKVVSHYKVLEKPADLFLTTGIPEHLRSNNGSEFTAKIIHGWLPRLGVKTLFITPGSPWENGYIEPFNGKSRDELPNWEIFDTVLEAKVLTDDRRRHYNTVRPHTALNYRPPGP
jgi:transposase InsO family protein